MDIFTASSGFKIQRDEGAVKIFSPEGANTLRGMPWLGARDIQALREFLQAERDEELGRWRWPENPDYVVYPKHHEGGGGEKSFRVFQESTGDTWSYHLEGIQYAAGDAWDAARAYFDAHPEPRPWEDAKEGDVWLLTINGEEEALLFRHDRTFISRDGDEFAPEESYITAGRRIYPEVSDADR